MTRPLYRLFSRTFFSDLAWRLWGSGLRILAYHGICADDMANQPWVPDHFVTHSIFQAHLKYLTDRACVLKLSEAARLLSAGRLPRRATCITFDDGYANNLYEALPLLEKYSVPATIFIATAHTRSGELLPFDKARLIHLHRTGVADYSSFYKLPLDELERLFAAPWAEMEDSIPQEAREALRPLTVEELSRFPADIVELGAHTRTHCILLKENEERRREEICGSLQDISEWTGNPTPMFSYPTGAFDDLDKRVLREWRCPAAVTTMLGRNTMNRDLLQLERYTMAMGHDLDGFIAEVTGFRPLLYKHFASPWSPLPEKPRS